MKVLIADDHAILRAGVKQIISGLPDILQVDEATDGTETLMMMKRNNYDMAVLDISMQGMSGLDVLQQLKDLGIASRILVLSLHPHEQYATRAINMGAYGYVSKSSAFREIENAIKKVAAGGRYISSELAEKLIFGNIDTNNGLPHKKLSNREFQVMIMIAKGSGLKDIAAALQVSDKTISTYRKRLLVKMNFKNNSEIIMYAIKNGLLDE
jgi:two-component system, NarL family, invasion response regulator UvrY